MRWTLRKKLILSFLAVALLTAVSGFFGLFNIAKIGSALSVVADREAPILGASLQMKAAVQEGEKAIAAYRSVTATVPTVQEGISLDGLQKKYETVLARFDALSEAIRQGGTVDGQRIAASDNERLRGLVREAEEILRKEFQPRAKELMDLGKRLIEGKKRVDASLVSMSEAHTKAVEAEAAANAALKVWIRATHLAKNSMQQKVACSVCHGSSLSAAGEGGTKNLPMTDVAEAQLLALGEGQVAMAEAARLVDPAKLAEMEKRFQASASDFMTYTNSLLKGGQTPKGNTRRVTDPKVRALIEKVLPPYQNFQSAAAEVFKEQHTLIAAKLEAEKTASALQESAHQIDGKLAEILKLSRGEMDAARTSAQDANSSANFTLILTIIISVLLSVAMGVVASGRLSGSILRIGRELEQSANQVASAAGEISTGSQDLAAGATEQASSLEETSASLEEMAAMTRQNADNAEQANLLAGQASADAAHGQSAMDEMNDAMTEINASAEKIAGIIKVIDDIAFQTNLLALNAAVEAARAGEHGKGFAVVAEEVRSLAQRSATAAKDTAQLIEESVGRTRRGTELSGKCAEALEKIVSGANKVVNLLSEIASASKEQSEGVGQLNEAVGQMDQITQRNAAAAEQSAAASEELSAQSHVMRERVAELVALVEGAKTGGPKFEMAVKTPPPPVLEDYASPFGDPSSSLPGGHNGAHKGEKANGASGGAKSGAAEKSALKEEDLFKSF